MVFPLFARLRTGLGLLLRLLRRSSTGDKGLVQDRQTLSNAYALIAASRFAEAIAFLEARASGQVSGAGETLFAAAFRGLRQIARASHHAKRAVCLEPGVAAPQAELARAVTALEPAAAGARELARRAAVLQPGHSEFWAFLSSHPIQGAAGTLGCRRTALKRWILLAPGMHAAWAIQGLTERETPAPDAALCCLYRATMIRPRDAGLQIALADAAFEGLRGDVFGPAVHRAQVLEPGNADPVMLTIQAERLRGVDMTRPREEILVRRLRCLLDRDTEGTLKTLRRVDVRVTSLPLVELALEAAKKDPVSARLWRRCGELLGGLDIFSQTHKAHATACVKRALAIDPGDAFAYQRLLRGLSRQERTARLNLSMRMICCAPHDVRLLTDRVVQLGAAGDASRLRVLADESRRAGLPSSISLMARGVAAYAEDDDAGTLDFLSGIRDVKSWGSHRGAGAFLTKDRLSAVTPSDFRYSSRWRVGRFPADRSDRPRMGSRYTVSISSDRTYLDYYLRDFLESAETNLPQATIHLSAINVAEEELGAYVGPDKPLSFRATGLKAERDVPLYASMARFLAVPSLLDETGSPVLVVDVDCRFEQPIDALEDLVGDADIGLDDPPDWVPWSRFPGGFVIFRPTPAGKAFARLMAAIQTTLLNEKPVWGGDQTALLMAVILAKTRLPHLKIAQLGGKGIWDIVSISTPRNIRLRYQARQRSFDAPRGLRPGRQRKTEFGNAQ